MNPDRDSLAALWRDLPVAQLSPDGRVVALSDAAVDFIGPFASRLVGRPLLDAIRPEVRGGGVSAEILSLRDPVFDPSPVFRIHRIPTPSGELVVFHDASELLRLRRQCTELTRMASAGRLISGIVHEINNPLSSIVGYSQLLLLRDLDSDTRAAVDHIHEEAQRTSRIVRNLLDFARRRKASGDGVKLSEIVLKAVELKAHDLRIHNVSTHLDLPASLPEVWGDRHQLLQVFVNLITNAEQAMYASDRGGRITIRARESEARDRVCVWFQDTGPGIPEAIRDQVFEPFFTTKAEGEGTGLGLDLCREWLARYDAVIELEGSGDCGASFRLSFQPRRSRGGSNRSERRPKAPRVRGRRILVVEDDPSCRSLLLEAFRAERNIVHAFDRSEAALRFLRNHVVDVIITDLHRPGMNGLEFLEQVSDLDPQLASRVVFLTGDTMNVDLARRVKRGGNLLLDKPVDIVRLHAAVQRVLSQPSRRQRELFEGDSLRA